MDTTRDLQMPSGWEVESAALHPDVDQAHGGKLERWKSRGLDLKSRGLQRLHGVRDGAKSQVSSRLTKVQQSMRTSPMLWAGIAAGAGFSLGMIGRVAQWRKKQKSLQPSLVIIEASC